MINFERARQPVPMKTAEAIHQMIRARNLRPGDQIPSQRELASELGVSRASLREALSMLETLGLISVQAGRGVFVAEERVEPAAATWRFGEQYALREVFELRKAIEGTAAAAAVTHMTAADIETIEAMCKEIEAAATQCEVVRVAENDARFHEMIFERCGNRLLQDIYKQLRNLMVESQQVPMVERTRLVETAVEHRRLVEAFRARNPDATRSAMEQHIRGSAGRAGLFL